jgi:hypothetical protein
VVDTAAAVAFGLNPEDLEEDAVELWPENELAVSVFAALSNQWRVGMGGAYALDYSAIEPTLRLMRIPRAKWSELFDCIQVMEGPGLRALREA